MYPTISIASACGDLACRVTGDGPSLVLLHGGAGSWTHWIRNIPALAVHFQVHAIDLPGCGDSPSVPWDLGASNYTALVADALAGYAGFQRPFMLAGFSFGAVVAAAVTARLPGRVGKLVLFGPGGFGSPVGRVLNLWKIPFGEDEVLVRHALSHNLREMMFSHPDTIDDDTVRLHLDNVARARFDSRRVSLSDRLLNDLAQIEIPVLIVWGEADNLAHPTVRDRARICQTNGRDVTVEIIPAAGHWVQYEAPGAVNNAMLGFLDHSFSASTKEARV